MEEILFFLTLFLLTLNPILVGYLLYQSTGQMTRSQDQCPVPQKQKEYCFSCQSVQMSEESSLTTKNESGRQLCCTTNTQYLKQRIRENFQTKLPRDLSTETHLKRIQTLIDHSYSRHGNQNKTAAHLVMMKGAPYNNSKVPTLIWNISSPRSFLNGGVEYHNGSMKVVQGGYYYVYSQILHTGTEMEELPYGRICHYLYRYNKRYKTSGKQKLSANLQSTCKVRRGEVSHVSSYIGASFYLEKDDEVSVLSSLPGNIHNSQQATYFGLYMV